MANVVEKKSTCLKVLKNFGEKAIILANKLEIVDKELEIKRDEAFSYVPLNRQPSEEELKTLREQLPNCEISTEIFHERKRQVAFTDLLEDKLPPHLLASLPRALDFVGDIAIIEIPPELEAYKTLVGE
ncbi:MAG: hypothetical protein QXH87_05810, partial [Candidatus Bathyarchaeia archaeon]